MNSTDAHPILCGTDFSSNASEAATVAALIAAGLGKVLVLVHAADEFNSYAESSKDLERVIEPLRQKLDAEVARLQSAGAAVRGELLTGILAEEAILEYSREHEPAMIVVSSVSKTAFDRWTLGSVSERVAQGSRTPTLVIRAGAPFAKWVRGEGLLKIIAGVDFTTSSDAGLRWIAQLERIGSCEITAAHLNWPPEDQTRLGVQARSIMGDNEPVVQRVLERDLKTKVAGLLGHERAQICVRASWGCVDAHLIELAAKGEADLIVVGSHQWHGLNRLRHRSISRNVLHHAPMNVACIPALVAETAEAPRVTAHRRVLAAVDSAEHGRLAIAQAYAVTERDGLVQLVHVLAPSREGDPEDRVKTACDQLRAMIPAEAESHGVRTEVEVVESDEVARAICQAAERFGADLVCVGANAQPGLTAKALGSVAMGVLGTCGRPVLVARPPAS